MIIPVITIDGASGVGKGTVSSRVAKHFNWHILDSGAIYRILALTAIKNKIALDDEIELAISAINLDLNFKALEELRTEECAAAASKVAALAKVREALLARQRACRVAPGLVADGRDMGTIVFPDAKIKIFLTATAEERAQRRYKQLKEKGINAKLSDIVIDITERDKRDRTRSIAPCRAADDAFIIDTTNLSIDQVVAQIINL
ncbi:(d)CMP kinase [Candidatus Marithrix sp. Canyon 246]|uniref:(d)CMP kinase n=1 Tax=Candidatus Marithrix sp. Canyon 246 TaxID=1827136 RepID=UPI000849EEF9|nr:(d)CMP kinase [Candidatus Marithrix sp. Canyon 246]